MTGIDETGRDARFFVGKNCYKNSYNPPFPIDKVGFKVYTSINSKKIIKV